MASQIMVRASVGKWEIFHIYSSTVGQQLIISQLSGSSIDSFLDNVYVLVVYVLKKPYNYKEVKNTFNFYNVVYFANHLNFKVPQLALMDLFLNMLSCI